ncbi:MAG: MotA/TolQ/ExbB proton channel family protein [Planctomycetes bacterium]|nr:MotA/TolQ/ExbB proton channel family protein [Planctomycetota bacterium]
MKLSTSGALAMIVVLLTAAPVVAQESGGTAQTQSLLDIFITGIEWPAYFILLGSVVAISLIIEHFLTVRRSNVAPDDQISKARDLIENRRFRDCLEHLQKSSTYFARVMTAALQHARHGFEAMHEAALEKSGEVSGRMFRKVEYLNILGNLGPLLGLLGTVWGMIIAFGELGQGGGEADAGGLARGISLALVNTLLGLALAIVGIGFFGFCRNRVDSLTVYATVESLNLLEYFRPAPAAGRSGEVRRAARAEASKSPPRPSGES